MSRSRETIDTHVVPFVVSGTARARDVEAVREEPNADSGWPKGAVAMR